MQAIKSFAELVFAPVLGFSEWVVLETATVSPAHLFVVHGSKMPVSFPKSSILHVGRRPRPLLEIAAEEAFWTLGTELIDKMLKEEFAINMGATASFAARLLKLITIILNCSELEASKILVKRCTTSAIFDGIDEILGSEECQSMLTKDEKTKRHVA